MLGLRDRRDHKTSCGNLRVCGCSESNVLSRVSFVDLNNQDTVALDMFNKCDNGYLIACALKLNQEMYSQNGNIEFMSGVI